MKMAEPPGRSLTSTGGHDAFQSARMLHRRGSMLVINHSQCRVESTDEIECERAAAHRYFLRLCGKYATAMPPAIVLLMSASGSSGQIPGEGVECSTPAQAMNPFCA